MLLKLVGVMQLTKLNYKPPYNHKTVCDLVCLHIFCERFNRLNRCYSSNNASAAELLWSVVLVLFNELPERNTLHLAYQAIPRPRCGGGCSGCGCAVQQKTLFLLWHGSVHNLCLGPEAINISREWVHEWIWSNEKRFKKKKINIYLPPTLRKGDSSSMSRNSGK